jgi:hypothetical protein
MKEGVVKEEKSRKRQKRKEREVVRGEEKVSCRGGKLKEKGR